MGLSCDNFSSAMLCCWLGPRLPLPVGVNAGVGVRQHAKLAAAHASSSSSQLHLQPVGQALSRIAYCLNPI